MALKIATTILLKIILINLVFIACVCHAKPKSGGGGSKPAGGGTDKKPVNPETCTCETFDHLCHGTSMLDPRIANFEDKELVCNPDEYQYCEIPKFKCSYRRIRSSFDLFGAHPWHVSIYDTSKPAKFIGSGVLIRKQYVLTVAHKVINERPGIKLRFGEWDRIFSPTCNTLEFTASKIITHPKYNDKMFTNDIALIKLDKEVDIAQYPHVNIACLASEVPAPGANCIVAGWGASMFHPNNLGITDKPSEKLQEVTLPIVPYDKCERALKATRLGSKYKLDKESFVCAGGELGRDACTGDGGSPLMCQNADRVLEVVGLTVGGIGCRSTVPGLYTNVPKFHDWIDHEISHTVDD